MSRSNGSDRRKRVGDVSGLIEGLERRVLLAGVESEMLAWHGHTYEVKKDSWVLTFEEHLGRAEATTRAAQIIRGMGARVTSLDALGRGKFVVFTATSDLSEGQVAKALIENAGKGVAGLEPNRIVRTDAVPNDALYGQQFTHVNTGQVVPDNPPPPNFLVGELTGLPGADIDSQRAWDTTVGTPSVVVAVVDTGTALDHPDLMANLWVNPGEIAGNGLDDDGNGYIDDVNGWDFQGDDANPYDGDAHGSHVAGTIAAVGNNQIGVAGVSWNSRILTAKIFPDGGGGATVEDIVEAYDYLTFMRTTYAINIVGSNNSYGAFAPASFRQFFAAEEAAILEFTSSGGVFVAAAGNDGNDNDLAFTSYPASYPNEDIVSVAATDNKDRLAGFSNYGQTTVDLGAPGVNILSTIPGGYAYFSGTSMASPTVAGAMALLKSARPAATKAQIKAALIEGVDLTPAMAGRAVGNGRLNAATSLRLIMEYGPNVTAVSPSGTGGPVSVIRVNFDKAINPALVTINGLELRRAGGDGVLGNINDVLITPAGLSVDANGLGMTITMSSTTPVDVYGLTLFANAFRDNDGNFLGGDETSGTSFQHQFTIVNVTGLLEPNDTIGQATVAALDANGRASFTGVRIGDGAFGALDVDIFRVSLSGAGLITAEIAARTLPNGSSLDSFVRLFDGGGVQLATNDNYASLDSRLQFFVPAGGTYYIGVSGFPNQTYLATKAGSGVSQATGTYNLSIDVDVVRSERRTYTAVDLPIDIPELTTTPVRSFIDVPDGRVVLDANVTLDVDHPYVGDLVVRLISPTGVAVTLVRNRGLSGDDLSGTTLDDQATTAIGAPGSLAPFSGRFRPETPLSAVESSSALGTWTLEVSDTKGLDSGRLLGWSLELELSNNISGDFELNDTLAVASGALAIVGSGSRTLAASVGDGAFGLKDVDIYSFRADAGTTVTLVTQPIPNTGVGPANAVQPVVKLLDASGNVIAQDDFSDQPTAAIRFPVANPGLYFIAVSGEGSDDFDPNNAGSNGETSATGRYTLAVSVVGGISDPDVTGTGTVVGVGLASDGTLGRDTGSARLGLTWTGDVPGGQTRTVDFLAGQTAGQLESFIAGTFGGRLFRNAGTLDQSDVAFLISNESDFANRRIVVDGTYLGLGVRRAMSFGLNDSFIAIDVTLRNTSASSMSGVTWIEGFNPNQGLNLGQNDPMTFNDVSGLMTTATYVSTDFRDGITIALAAPGNETRATPSVEDPGSVRDPSQVIGDAFDPDGAESDSLLTLAYDLGALASGAAVTFRYFVFVGDSLADVTALQALLNSGGGLGHLRPDPNATQVAEHLPWTIYMPEGFSSQRVNEFVPIFNPNKEDATVLVRVFYEGDFDSEILFAGTIAGGARSGLTLNTPATAAAGESLVRLDTPYAIQINSSVPVSANLSHFDFGIATGSAFTSQTSTVWTFSEGFRGQGINDFLVLFNPGTTGTKVTITVYSEDADTDPVSVVTDLPAGKRGGANLAGLEFAGQLPDGPFAIRVDADEPIVAMLSHYDSNIGGGFSVLGQANAGSLQGVSPEGQLGRGSTDEFITVINTNTQPASVTFSFLFASGSTIRTSITVPAQRRGGLSVASVIGFPVGSEPYAVAFESNLPVSALLPSYGDRGTTSSRLADEASSTWLFADGFRPAAGDDVSEYLRLFNPTATAIVAEITLSYEGGGSDVERVTLNPRAANEFNVHDLVSAARRSSDAFYSIRVKTPEPIVAFLARFDDFLGGGSGTLGSPLGAIGPVL